MKSVDNTVRIVSGDLELDYFDQSSKTRLELIRDMAGSTRAPFFGDLDTLISNLDNGYIIYLGDKPIGFISISTVNELAILIKSAWQLNGIGQRALELLTKIDKRGFVYYIDDENTVAQSLEKKIGGFQLSRL